MTSPIQTDPINPRYEECLRLRGCWGWFLVLGIILIAVGFVALSWAFVTTVTSVLIYGCLLVGGGVVQIVNAFLARSWRAFSLYLLAGILSLVVGALMIEQPVRGAEALTLMLALAFLVGGTLRTLYALIERFPGWPWVLLNGLITLALGLSIWKQWPDSAFWVIGLFVGIDIILNGWSWVMLGLLVKAASSQHNKTPAPASGS